MRPGIRAVAGVAFAAVVLAESHARLADRSQSPASARPAAVQRLADAEAMRALGTAESIRGSIPVFEEALGLARAAGDTTTEAAALTGLGRAEDGRGNRRRAIDLFDQALAIDRAGGDAASEAATLNFKGLAEDALGDRAAARRSFDAALTRARDAGDTRIEGLALNNIGLVQLNLGDRRGAIGFYEQALALHKTARNARGEATTLVGLGSAYDGLGDKTRALEYFNEALPLHRRIGDRRLEATTLANIGAVYYSLDDLARAMECYTQALPLLRTAGDAIGEGATLHNIASVEEQLGRYQSALEHYQQALALHRAVKYRAGEGNTLTNLARLYSQLGDPETSLDLYQQAIAVHRAVGNRPNEGTALNNIGLVYARLGDLGRAAGYWDQALAIARATGNRGSEASVLMNTARTRSARGEYDAAADLYQRSLELTRALGSRRGEAQALGNLAAMDAARGRTASAAANFESALALNRRIGNAPGETALLLSLARFEADRGRLTSAREHLASAFRLIEGVRSSVTNDDLRTTYFATKQDYYELDVDLAMRLDAAEPGRGWVAQALESAERARARSLIDLLAEARVDIREGVDAALVGREREIERDLRRNADRQTRLLSGPHTEAQARAAADEIRELTAAYQDVEARIRRTSPRYAALTQPEPLTASRIQRELLDPDTLLLEYVIGTPRSFVFAVTNDSLDAYELPARGAIDESVRAYYRLAQTPDRAADAQRAAASLGRALLQPVARHLPGRARVAIVASGALQVVPFAALPAPGAPGRPLIADREVVALPSASVLAMLRDAGAPRRATTRGVLVFADPVFRDDDPRVHARPAPPPPAEGAPAPRTPLQRSIADLGETTDPGRLSRLIGTRRESAAIAALLPRGGVRQALDFEATRAAATGPDAAAYRVVHFATHALVNHTHPALSGIVLSLVDRDGAPQDGFLRMHDVFNLRLGADLVVLSACQTALGKEIPGEGLIGLARAFMYAGAPRVVATAWKVDDAASAELMKRFYEGMFGRERLRPAAALRAAQLALRRQRRFAAPYYWAPFVLQGEWR